MTFRGLRKAQCLGFRALIAGAALFLFCGQLSGLSAHAGDVAHISIGTASATGIYFAAGNAICRILSRQARLQGATAPKLSLDCAAPATPGSIFNINAVRDRSLTFGIVQADWQFHAYNGSSKFKDQKFPQLRSVFSLHPEAFQILANKESRIASFDDLKGKRVNLGEKGSGTRATFETLMSAEGVDKSFFGRADELPQADQNKLLCDGGVDAISYSIGIPNAAVREAVEKCGATIVDLVSIATRKLLADNPYYSFTTIPRATYAGLTAEATTFGVRATLVTRSDTPDDVVYALVKAVFENLSDLKAMHLAFAGLDEKSMITEGLSAPLHPGAIRYYRERGWWRPNGS